MSYSSLEHAGLGRYGDPINPDGDLMELAKLSCLVKPGGLLIFGVPVDDDCVKMNWHRYYGPRRYPMLTECWRLVEYEDFPVRTCITNEWLQPWFIFQNLRGCLVEAPSKRFR